MPSFITVLLAVMVSGVVFDAAAALPARSSKMVQIKQHLQQVFDFPCMEPQRRAILLSDSGHVLSTGMYSPPVTVLHRCDRQAGCCGDRFECAPLTTETITRTFTLLTTSGRKYEHFTFTNHTSCSCQELTPPK